MRLRVRMRRVVTRGFAVATLALIGSSAAAQPKPVPRMQTVPQPQQQVSFQRDGFEIARYHFGSDVSRPYVFPLIGPSGRSVTRIGHPHDPQSHSHHYSVWVGHRDVNGVNFWEDRGKAVGRIVHQILEDYLDSSEAAAVQTVNGWLDPTGRTLLTERRRITAQWLPNQEWLLIIDIQLSAAAEPITLGKGSFGPIAVRMAKTIGVHDGGGTIRNSAGAVNEKEVFWKPAQWVDYSGLITPTATEGATLFDHPSNPNHPAVFHVRDDGWMGASLTFDGPRVIAPGTSLRLRYGVYVHAGRPAAVQLQQRWEEFARMPSAELAPRRK
jgi:hypothetical protein